MRKIRIGNDVVIRWAIYTKEGAPYDLTGRNLRLFLNSQLGGSAPVFDFKTEGNVVVWTFKGKNQKRTGNYSLTLVENYDSDDMHTVDTCTPFRLETTSANTSSIGGCPNIELNTLELASEMAVSFPEYAGYGVDSELSDDSINPVQNRVVKAAIEAVAPKVVVWNADSSLNDDVFKVSGIYSINGVRVNNDDNLPIYNMGDFSARLTVLATGNCVTQLLTLLNVGGGDGNVYVRTWQNGIWKQWGKLQTNVEVGLIGFGQQKSLDDFVDNGMYSGVNAYATGERGSDGYPIYSVETFVLVVVNAYLYGGGVTQLKYSLLLDGTVGVKTRVKKDGSWSDWIEVGENITVDSVLSSSSINPVQNKVLYNCFNSMQTAINKKTGYTVVTWGNSSDINKYTTEGHYRIKGERLNEADGLPIDNAASGHTINAWLLVLDSSISGTGESDDKCITQKLTLCNRTGGDGDVYIRTGRGASAASIIWGPWGKLQQNIEVQTDSLDSYIDNGMYSGVNTGTGGYPEMFVIVVLNNYALAGKMGLERTITQFKLSHKIGDNEGKMYKRIGTGNPVTWQNWEEIG